MLFSLHKSHKTKNIKFKIIKKKNLNKTAFEIIKIIEILYFIIKEKITNYIKFIVDNIEKFKDFKKLNKYLNKNWFSKNTNLFNYSTLLEYIRNKNSNDLILEKFYITNNISESLHKKINSYLPKTSTTPKMFFKAMKKLFLDNCKKGNKNRLLWIYLKNMKRRY